MSNNSGWKEETAPEPILTPEQLMMKALQEANQKWFEASFTDTFYKMFADIFEGAAVDDHQPVVFTKINGESVKLFYVRKEDKTVTGIGYEHTDKHFDDIKVRNDHRCWLFHFVSNFLSDFFRNTSFKCEIVETEGECMTGLNYVWKPRPTLANFK